MAGPGIQPQALIESPSVYDILPTTLYVLGLPIARDMPGQIWKKAFDPGFLSSHPVEFIETYETSPMGDSRPIESGVDDAILEKLRALGYID